MIYQNKLWSKDDFNLAVLALKYSAKITEIIHGLWWFELQSDGQWPANWTKDLERWLFIETEYQHSELFGLDFWGKWTFDGS